jgi:hypothetical protein
MPIVSIDLFCREGCVRVSFNPPVRGENVLALRDTLVDLEFEELRERLQATAVEWSVTVNAELLP